jgi:hypothetical protein
MRLRAVAGVLCVVSLSVHAQDRAPANESIRKDALKADLFFLASDSLRGRLTDTPENRIAAEYVASRFARMGLTPATANGSYFHDYELMVMRLGAPDANSLVVRRGQEADRSLRPGPEYYPQRFSGSGKAQGELVFAGFGISSPERSYDDYRGDLKGKVVLVMDHEPGESDPASPFDGVVTAEAAAPWRKALAAQEKGAVAILFVRDVHNHEGQFNFENASRNAWPATPPRIERYTLATWMQRIRIPAAQISPELADALVAGTGKRLADLARASEGPRGVTPLPLPGVTIALSAAVERRAIPDRNVLGLIEGSDPRLKNELVIVCAHYDHDGATPDRILNGADDDGSGTVGLMAIAEAYAEAARAGRRPRRSVLFAAWNSEERGLLGAWAYTEHPTRPLEHVVAVLNMDMIGRNEEVPAAGGGRFRGLDQQTAESNQNAINIIGTTRSADMKAAVERANRAFGLELKFRYDNNTSNLMRRSDHWPFLQRGVPALWFHTGLHPDYHTAQDRPERINYDKMEKIARLVHQMSWDLAQEDRRPRLAERPTIEQ